MVADLLGHAVEGGADLADLVIGRHVDADRVVLVAAAAGRRRRAALRPAVMRFEMPKTAPSTRQKADRQDAGLVARSMRLVAAGDLGLRRIERGIDLAARDDEAERQVSLDRALAGIPQIGRRQAVQRDDIRDTFAPSLLRKMLRMIGLVVCRAAAAPRSPTGCSCGSERSRPVTPLPPPAAAAARPSVFSPERRDRQHVAVRHGQEAEAGLGDLDALDDLGELVEGDIGADHAGDILAVLRPQRMEEGDDELAGDRVGIGRRHGDVARHRAELRELDPVLPVLVDAGEEEIPEVRLVMAGIELVEGLRLIGIGRRAHDRPILRADIIHLQLGCAGRHQARGEDVEDGAVLDVARAPRAAACRRARADSPRR